MRALVVEPHDVNELIFASYLSHPFLALPDWQRLSNRGESTETPIKFLFRCGSVRMDIDAPPR
ncbi:MAG: hypothetical protein RIQ39_42 [Actinomycetota bacterium]|jgi:hypothetical protein